MGMVKYREKTAGMGSKTGLINTITVGTVHAVIPRECKSTILLQKNLDDDN